MSTRGRSRRRRQPGPPAFLAGHARRAPQTENIPLFPPDIGRELCLERSDALRRGGENAEEVVVTQVAEVVLGRRRKRVHRVEDESFG